MDSASLPSHFLFFQVFVLNVSDILSLMCVSSCSSRSFLDPFLSSYSWSSTDTKFWSWFSLRHHVRQQNGQEHWTKSGWNKEQGHTTRGGNININRETREMFSKGCVCCWGTIFSWFPFRESIACSLFAVLPPHFLPFISVFPSILLWPLFSTRLSTRLRLTTRLAYSDMPSCETASNSLQVLFLFCILWFWMQCLPPHTYSTINDLMLLSFRLLFHFLFRS